ncbi:MAG: GNAT family N-acetyltransferase [Flavobacteriaceae bacterium]|nr:GNAT family N-acetyltransferase [Flavobacteriaceae bacterium]MDZ4147351.1 GNAT family N-acetyltransferase [Flavobacteriaceae bacterium]
MIFSIKLFDKLFDRAGFDCTKPPLNEYLTKQVSQDIKRNLSVCFVLLDKEDVVKGYYTLSNSSIPQKHIPRKFFKKFPNSYADIPVTLLGRLAIDKSIFKKGHGELLLIDALKQSYEVSQMSIGSVAVVVDPIDGDAMVFYEKYGFIKLEDSGKMFLPMNVIAKLFE